LTCLDGLSSLGDPGPLTSFAPTNPEPQDR